MEGDTIPFNQISPTVQKVRIFESTGATRSAVDFELKADGTLELTGHDVGEAAERSFGRDDYEYWVTVETSDKDKLLLALLAERFAGDAQASTHLMKYLESKGVRYKFDSWP